MSDYDFYAGMCIGIATTIAVWTIARLAWHALRGQP